MTKRRMVRKMRIMPKRYTSDIGGECKAVEINQATMNGKRSTWKKKRVNRTWKDRLTKKKRMAEKQRKQQNRCLPSLLHTDNPKHTNQPIEGKSHAGPNPHSEKQQSVFFFEEVMMRWNQGLSYLRYHSENEKECGLKEDQDQQLQWMRRVVVNGERIH